MEKNKLQHVTTDKLISDIRSIIEQGRQQAYSAANQIAVLTYWHIGRRIVEEEQHGEVRAQYGTRLIKTLAEQLMPNTVAHSVNEIWITSANFICVSMIWRL